MKMSHLLGALALLALSAASQAQTRATPCDPATANNAICITGAAVTTGTNGEVLTGVTYRAEQKSGAGAYSTVATGLTTLQYYAKNLAPGTYTFRVYVSCTNVGCVESLPSNAATKDATANPIQPNTPVLIIAATIRANAPPTYRIVYTVKPKADEVVFVAPESMRKLFASK